MNNLWRTTVYRANFSFAFLASIFHEVLYALWDGSVGIATRYGVDCPRIEFRWRREFPHSSRTALESCPVSCSVGSESLSGGVKAAETWL